jgi:hypothetical protein
MIETIPDKIAQFIPFLAVDCGGNGKPKLNTARILELVLTGAVLLYGMNVAVAKLEVKMDSIEKHVGTLDSRLYEHMIAVDKATRK